MRHFSDLLESQRHNSGRRRFIAAAGVAAASALATGIVRPARGGARADDDDFDEKSAAKGTQHYSDTDILNFALNLEYLEAEFYLRATTGVGLADSQITGVTGSGKKPTTPATPGDVTGGAQIPFATPLIQQYAKKIAADEKAHVDFLRLALGKRAVARPAIDLQNSFNAAAQAAGIGQSFDPFASEANFLLGAFVFEDVGVTAYHGAAGLIKNTAFVNAAAGILGTEAYHAGSVRTTLLALGQSTPALIATANKIVALRASADGSGNGGHEEDLTTSDGSANIAPVDASAITFARTFREVLNIVYLGAGPGGFFPNGLNGKIA